MWDDAADRVVRALFERGEVERVNDLLAGWTHNAQPLPAGLPADLRAFIDDARRLPAWADRQSSDAAFDFYERRGLYLGVLYGLGSGMMSCVIPREARAVYYSAGGADMKDRIAKTAKLGYDIGADDAFGPGGQMVVTCVKTRLTHAAVRHLLPQSRTGRRGAEEAEPDQPGRHHGHLAQPGHLQPGTSWAPGRSRSPAADAAAFLHLWQVTAHMLGVKDEYIPATWDEANAQSRQVLDPIAGAHPRGHQARRDPAQPRGGVRPGPQQADAACVHPLLPGRPDRGLAPGPARTRRPRRPSPPAGRRSSLSARRR